MSRSAAGAKSSWSSSRDNSAAGIGDGRPHPAQVEQSEIPQERGPGVMGNQVGCGRMKPGSPSGDPLWEGRPSLW